MDTSLATYLIVTALLVASPGPDSILILKNTLGGSKKTGAMTVIGVQVGVVLHALLSIIGLSALLYYSPAAFRILALAGSLYLVYLGYLTIAGASLTLPPRHNGTSNRKAFAQGLLCNLLNPKVIILFLALMPTFVDYNAGNETEQIIVLALLLLAINTPFQFMLVLIAHHISRLLATPRSGQLIQRGLGILLIVFACMVFIDHVLSYTR